jgi:SAM-dependent methyltransferase
MLEETRRVEQRHFWFRGFRRFIRPFLTEATSGVTRPRLLDCGCGMGTNLTFLQQFGVPFGVDLTWRGLQFAHGKGVPRLVQATVAALPFSAGAFDAAVSFDVLYCLEDAAEQQAIAEMYRVLRPGGAIVVNAAALDMLKGDHSVLVSEVRRYTRGSLTAKLARAGFRVDRITYTNAALFPVTAGVRALQRLRGVKPEGGPRGDFYMPPAPVNGLFSGALALEAQLIAAGLNMPIGSSVLCLARKVGT